MNQLDSLKKFSTIVADTGDIESIQRYAPQDATTNPSLLLKSVMHNKKYQKLIINAISYAQKKGGNKNNKIFNASSKLAVNIGAEILKKIPGYISTEIDARFSFNYEMSIKHAINLINMYEELNINKKRILIKLAATWEGIQAANELKKHGIKCNLTLLFSFAQAQACAESYVYLISPFVGRIYDWYHHNQLLSQPYNCNNDPGVQAIHKIFLYYKKYNYPTIIMAASFRNIEQITALAGCDRLTISPDLLEILQHNKHTVKQKLFPPDTQIMNTHTPLSETDFHKKHNKNTMAVQKLLEGIHKFSTDQQKIEKILNNLL
ncbi:transaldolase [Blochmannia endosymbiont of Polyrhachis (Hedomyrma) turneri]|uniref:transaldolase n=1 Tax=Blochmannia endosymbiont of Polyrhachis (Hedomyrma) turneri TaxID=1505596 RepID=UPI00061A852E|nr:transaldolase [Blochmannia endosymbiont of Polyrhachis (Hedomyrma) turneri]AKC60075.1 transaldolase A [Blochmannia endosymbiont of Polyrhachis (Hedomyrma) turneri]